MYPLRRLLRGAGHRRPRQAARRAVPASRRRSPLQDLRPAPGSVPILRRRLLLPAHRGGYVVGTGGALSRSLRTRGRGAPVRRRVEHARRAAAEGRRMTFEELKAVLFVRSNFGMKLGLTRMREALRLLGDPHRGYAVLHVAGTNGKGSTCAFAEASLRAAGLRTGLYTSPHLVPFCERIRIGGTPISEERAAGLFEEIARRVPWALDADGLTFFELATAMAFLEFTRSEIDVAVVEVGLGGRLDATNLVEPMACAIAALGLDHLQWLGPTLADVAAEKAGILKRGAPAVSAGQTRVAAAVLERRARELEIPLWRPGRDYRFESRSDRNFCYQGPTGFTVRPGGPLALAGAHQRANAALSCALLEAAATRGLRVAGGGAANGLVQARWHARLETVARDPPVLVDGAHNG